MGTPAAASLTNCVPRGINVFVRMHAVKLRDDSTLRDSNPSVRPWFNFLMENMKWVVVLREGCAEGPLGLDLCLLWESSHSYLAYFFFIILLHCCFPAKVPLQPSTTFTPKCPEHGPRYISPCSALGPEQNFLSGWQTPDS